MSEFDIATQVEPLGPGPDGRLRYAATIAGGWDVYGNANGGYQLAIAARAMADAVGRPPLTVTAHYLAPGRPGPAEVLVDVHRMGRRMATAGAVLRGADSDTIRVLGTFGEPAGDGPGVVHGAPPELPGLPEDGEPVSREQRGIPAVIGGFAERIDVAVHPDDVGFRRGNPSGVARMRGWFRWADRVPVDVFGLLVAADSLPPVVFTHGAFPVTWAPTLELTVHVRGVPTPGPLRCAFTSRFMQGGLFEEDGEVWDANGHLVAQSRQLALLPR